MLYTIENFKSDLINKDFIHLNSDEHFKCFYNELGKMPIQRKQKYQEQRMKFLKPRGDILELGCHIGFNLIYYANLGFNITGVDVSSTLIEVAKKKISEEPIHIRQKIKLINDFIEYIKINEKFETIILTEVLEHCQNPINILLKAKSLLADNGFIYISTPPVLCGNSSHVRGIDRDEMLDLLSKTGLKVEKWFEEDTNLTILNAIIDNN